VSYYNRSILFREHLGLSGMVIGSRQVQQYKPRPEYVEDYAQVVKVMKERDTHVNM